MQTVPLYVCEHVRVCVCVCVCLYANILAHMPSAIIVAATWASNFRSPAVHSSELAARSRSRISRQSCSIAIWV